MCFDSHHGALLGGFIASLSDETQEDDVFQEHIDAHQLHSAPGGTCLVFV